MRLRRDTEEWVSGSHVLLSRDIQGPGVTEREQVETDDFKREVSKATGFLTWNATTIGIAGACTAGVIIVVILGLVWYRNRLRRKRLLQDLTFDDDQLKSVKSAPASRTPSPRLNKRMSCPDALSMHTSRGLMVRSVASDRIPDFTLPPERVQPYSPIDQRTVPNLSAHQRKCSLGSVRPELYHHPSFSEEDEPNLPETTHGRIWFTVVYDDAMEQLHVTLIKVKDLPGRNGNNQPRDPFVKMFLLPDERCSRTSKSKKKTLSPVYNETHSFQVASNDVQNRVVRFSVYDVDKRRILHSLGHVMINLKTVDLHKGEVMWSDLEPMAVAAASLGEMQLSLAFYPQNDKIRMGIHRARNLHQLAEMDDVASYVRVQLYYGHKSHRLKTTRVCRQQPGSTEHSFNETLSFTVNGRQLDQCNLTLSLMVVDPRATADKEVGRLTIGPFMYARGEQLMHWQEMVARPRAVTTRWHTLTGSNNPTSS